VIIIKAVLGEGALALAHPHSSKYRAMWSLFSISPYENGNISSWV